MLSRVFVAIVALLSVQDLQAGKVCAGVKVPVVLVGTVHSNQEKELQQKLIKLAGKNKLVTGVEGISDAQKDVIEKAFGTSRNTYGLDQESIVMTILGMTLIQVHRRAISNDFKTKDKQTLLKALLSLKKTDGFKEELLRGCLMYPDLRNLLKENQKSIPRIFAILDKVDFLEVAARDPLKVQTEYGANLVAAIKSNIRLPDTAYEAEWVKLGELIVEANRKAAKLGDKPHADLDRYLKDPLAKDATHLRNTLTIELRDRNMIQKIGVLCTLADNAGIPLVVPVGAGHIPGLKLGVAYTLLFGDATHDDIDLTSDFVRIKDVPKFEKEMTRASAYADTL